MIRDLNQTYRELPALHQLDCDGNGFEWLESDNSRQSLLAYMRKGEADTPPVLVIVNLTPSAYQEYTLGVPRAGHYRERLNTDSGHYGGSNMGNSGNVITQPVSWMGQAESVELTLPPLGMLILQPLG